MPTSTGAEPGRTGAPCPEPRQLPTPTSPSTPSSSRRPRLTRRSGGLGLIAGEKKGQADPSVPGVTAGNVCPACNFEGHASGNVDTDTTIDTWFISSKDASVTGACGNTDTAAPAGTPFNTNN